MKITLCNKEHNIERCKFRKWIELEQIRDKIQTNLRNNSSEEASNAIIEYISQCIDIDKDEVNQSAWSEVAMAFVNIMSLNEPRFIPAYMRFVEQQKERKEIWDYDNRAWYVYAHMLAKEYGWTLDYSANLDIDDALKMIQEIMLEGQLRKEWEWTCSQNSVGYDSSTKQSKIIELPRPTWMRPAPAQPKKVKILKAHLPMGMVIKYDEHGQSSTIDGNPRSTSSEQNGHIAD